VPQWWVPGFLIFGTLELVVPIWAERAEPTTWNAHHIAERYGLFTLIVLGESVASATMAVGAALDSGEAVSALASIIVGGLLIVYALWWTYFDRPVHDLLTSLRTAIVWGYGHYLVFASVAAVGAGLAVSVDQVTHHAEISGAAAGASVAIPVALYLLCLWYLHDRPEYRRSRAFGPLTVIVILLTPMTGHAVLLTGVILSTLVGVKLVMRSRGVLG
jgi:low temperature requirement protein LtrA